MHLLERDKSKLETNFSKLIALHLTCIKKGGGIYQTHNSDDGLSSKQ
jgi:hypothetical protein